MPLQLKLFRGSRIGRNRKMEKVITDDANRRVLALGLNAILQSKPIDAKFHTSDGHSVR
ncbi:MAG: hypothetical protein Udaeo2_30370 [Candidatus Udaeobacter sp.]|nr:MAG: hypothetical protein Udaeo2_30370 [Candidatus Udaeobacter sp.]